MWREFTINLSIFPTPGGALCIGGPFSRRMKDNNCSGCEFYHTKDSLQEFRCSVLPSDDLYLIMLQFPLPFI